VKTKECNVPGCEARIYKAGVCREHHEQNYTLGCSVAKCDREVFAKGLCKAHYNRKWKKKKGRNVETPMDAPVRGWGEAKFEVFTRIPKEYADVILREAGREDGMYEKSKEILVAWAKRRMDAHAP
jgi:hypothetical protein